MLNEVSYGFNYNPVQCPDKTQRCPLIVGKKDDFKVKIDTMVDNQTQLNKHLLNGASVPKNFRKETY